MMDKQTQETAEEKCRKRKTLRASQRRKNCSNHPEREVRRNRLRERKNV